MLLFGLVFFPVLVFYSNEQRNSCNLVFHPKISVADDMSEDRMIALRKRAEVDTKNLIIFVPDDQLELKQSLSRHGPVDLSSSFFLNSQLVWRNTYFLPKSIVIVEIKMTPGSWFSFAKMSIAIQKTLLAISVQALDCICRSGSFILSR